MFFAFILTLALQDSPRPLTLEGPTNWGVITRVGGNFTLEGQNWSALGHTRADGKVVIIWTDLNNGNACPGLYEVTPTGELQGYWGRNPAVVLQEDGTLSGMPSLDRVYRLPDPEPDI
jgi:hypothetical protein